MNKFFKVLVVFTMVVTVHQVVARPPSRVKRVSDTHLADIETKIALNKLGGIAITLPVGAGRIDPARIGRKRRSESRFLDVLFNQSEEDNGDPLGEYEEFVYDKLYGNQ